ncbi:MAG TPA: hypothetical protein VG735_07215 [Caulobacterales bacterium]|nr:hypothetical protein [Caulobacterales bacterium]
MEQVVIALLAAGLALAGALAQAFIARMHSQEDRRKELLIEAYTDYLKGLAEWATRDQRSKAEAAGKASILTGKQKIAAYAPSQVVRKLAALERTSLNMSQPDAQSAMVALVSSMRQSVGVRWRGLEADIRLILMGSRRNETT